MEVESSAGGGHGSLLRDIIRNHWEVVSMFWSEPKFRAPMIVIWVASFGSAMHAPVTTYYYLELGDWFLHNFCLFPSALHSLSSLIRRCIPHRYWVDWLHRHFRRPDFGSLLWLAPRHEEWLRANSSFGADMFFRVPRPRLTLTPTLTLIHDCKSP